MAKKISELSADTQLDGTEQLVLAQGGSTSRTSLETIKSYITADLQQNISASTNPVVAFKEYPVSGTIQKGQAATLALENNVLKIKKVQNSVTSVVTNSARWGARLELDGATATDGSDTVQVYPNANSILNSYPVLIKQSDTKYYLCFRGPTRVRDSYDVEASTNKPKEPKRVVSEAISGSTIHSLTILPFTVDLSDGSVTWGEAFYFVPEAFRKIKQGTENLVDNQLNTFNSNTFSVCLLDDDKILIGYNLWYQNFVPTASAMSSATLPSGKDWIFRDVGNIRSSNHNSSYYSIVNPNTKEQWFAEYDNYYANHFSDYSLIGIYFYASGNPVNVTKISPNRFFSFREGTNYNTQGQSGASDDDGRVISTSSRQYYGKNFFIFDITEGTEEVDGETINTFSLSKIKYAHLENSSYSSFLNYGQAFLRGQQIIGYNGRITLNSTFTDFIRNWNATTNTFEDNTQPVAINQSGISWRVDRVRPSSSGYPYSYYTSLSGSGNNIRGTLNLGAPYPTATRLSQVIDTSDEVNDRFDLFYVGLSFSPNSIFYCRFKNGSDYGIYIKDITGLSVEREDLTLSTAFGVAGDNYSDGDTGRLFFFKSSTVLDLYTGLNVGTTYYINFSGNITTEPVTSNQTNKILGRAISTTEIALL